MDFDDDPGLPVATSTAYSELNDAQLRSADGHVTMLLVGLAATDIEGRLHGVTRVREAMKPRPAMFVVPTNTTVERFIEMLRNKHYSRVPVYEGSVHNIKGIVYAQDVLQVPDTEAHVRTLDTLMRRDVYFVPESKLGSDLLREMQKSNIRMAIVVDEYGGVAGLVTIEDLVEEIVA